MIALKTILVATDFGEAADKALLYGRNFARAFSATLHVVHVVDDISTNAAATTAAPAVDLRDVQTDLERDAQNALDAHLTDDDRQSLDIRPLVLTSHYPARTLLDYARAVRADLIIVGTHGRGMFSEFVLGSVAQKIVRLASCPVLTVRTDEREFVVPDALAVTTAVQAGAVPF